MRRVFCVSAPGLGSLPKLNNPSPVALGWPAREPGDELLHGFALHGNHQARFAARIRLAVERLGNGCRTANVAHRKDLDFKTAAFVLNHELVAAANLARGLGSQPVRFNSAQIAGARGQ